MLRLSHWRLTLWRLNRWWQRRQRQRWLTHYAQAIKWHSDHTWHEAHAMAYGVLLDDPGALTWRDPTEAALRDLGITREDLA